MEELFLMDSDYLAASLLVLLPRINILENTFLVLVFSSAPMRPLMFNLKFWLSGSCQVCSIVLRAPDDQPGNTAILEHSFFAAKEIVLTFLALVPRRKRQRSTWSREQLQLAKVIGVLDYM